MNPEPLLRSALIACVAGGLLAKPILMALHAAKSKQTVSQHIEEHLKKQGTPTMGGLIILAGYIIATLVSGSDLMLRTLPLLLGFAVIGFVDDYVVPKLMKGKRGLGWKQKFALQFGLAALGAYALGPAIGQQPTGLEFAWRVFLIVFFSNAYNFADGMDGLAGSILIVVSAGLAALGVEGSPLICATLIGATLPFLYFNAPPAKVFMGDVGALPIGALLGFLFSLPSGPGITGWIPLVIIATLLILELILVPIQLTSVKLRKKRIFPATPIHHSFEKVGWPETRVVSSFVLFQVVTTLIGLWFNYAWVRHA